MISVTIGAAKVLEASSCCLYCSATAALLVGVIEDGRAILRADVVALLVGRRRVVRLPEDFQQVVERDFGRVVRDLDHFGVAGAAGADFFVRRVLDVAAAVAGDDGLHAAEVLEDGLGAPEAAGAERGRFEFAEPAR